MTELCERAVYSTKVVCEGVAVTESRVKELCEYDRAVSPNKCHACQHLPHESHVNVTCHQMPRPPRKSTIDVTTCHVCYAKDPHATRASAAMPRLLHERSVSVTNCRACHTKVSMPPSTQKRAASKATRATKRAIKTNSVPPSAALATRKERQCHACHTKVMSMPPSAELCVRELCVKELYVTKVCV